MSDKYLEKGIYTIEMFTKRNSTLSSEIKSLQITESSLLQQKRDGGRKDQRVSKTFWTWTIFRRIMAPLSKGAANQLLQAIDWRGIPAVEVYKFAQHFGELVHGTANPSTANAVPLPLTREA